MLDGNIVQLSSNEDTPVPGNFPRVPADTKISVPNDPKADAFLDDFRRTYEHLYGVPSPNGPWAHQLSRQEVKALSKEELDRRTPPWQRAFCAWMIMEAMKDGPIVDLPEWVTAAILRIRDGGLSRSRSDPGAKHPTVSPPRPA